MPGGTPKKTAQVEEPRLRPRKRPGHSKLSGEATGTRPRLLEEPLAHVSFSSRRHLGDVDVEHVRDASPKRSFLVLIHRSQGATPFRTPLSARTLAVVWRGYKMRRRCRASVGETIATQPRSEAAMIDFLERR